MSEGTEKEILSNIDNYNSNNYRTGVRASGKSGTNVSTGISTSVSTSVSTSANTGVSASASTSVSTSVITSVSTDISTSVSTSSDSSNSRSSGSIDNTYSTSSINKTENINNTIINNIHEINNFPKQYSIRMRDNDRGSDDYKRRDNDTGDYRRRNDINTTITGSRTGPFNDHNLKKHVYFELDVKDSIKNSEKDISHKGEGSIYSVHNYSKKKRKTDIHDNFKIINNVNDKTNEKKKKSSYLNMSGFKKTRRGCRGGKNKNEKKNEILISEVYNVYDKEKNIEYNDNNNHMNIDADDNNDNIGAKLNYDNDLEIKESDTNDKMNMRLTGGRVTGDTNDNMDIRLTDVTGDTKDNMNIRLTDVTGDTKDNMNIRPTGGRVTGDTNNINTNDNMDIRLIDVTGDTNDNMNIRLTGGRVTGDTNNINYDVDNNVCSTQLRGIKTLNSHSGLYSLPLPGQINQDIALNDPQVNNDPLVLKPTRQQSIAATASHKRHSNEVKSSAVSSYGLPSTWGDKTSNSSINRQQLKSHSDEKFGLKFTDNEYVRTVRADDTLGERTVRTVGERTIGTAAMSSISTVGERTISAIDERTVGTVSERTISAVDERTIGTVGDRLTARMKSNVFLDITKKNVDAKEGIQYITLS
jgi:hypothetical protein